MPQRIELLPPPADRGKPVALPQSTRGRRVVELEPEAGRRGRRLEPIVSGERGRVPLSADRIQNIDQPTRRSARVPQPLPNPTALGTEVPASKSALQPIGQPGIASAGLELQHAVSLTLRPSMVLASSQPKTIECEVEVRDAFLQPVSGAFVKLWFANVKVVGTVGTKMIQVPQYTDSSGRATLLVPVTTSTGQYAFNPLPVQANVVKDGKLLGTASATLMVKNKEAFPSKFKELSDWPSPPTRSLVSQECQGITNDGKNWYFSLAPRPQVASYWPFQIVKYPMSETSELPKTLDQADYKGAWAGKAKEYYGPVTLARLPNTLLQAGYYHAGALCYHDGYLYVPLEATYSEINKHKPRIAVYTSDLDFVTSAEFPDPPAPQQCGWCAICPTDGLLYTSSTFDTKELQAYVPRLETDSSGGKTLSLEHHHSVPLLDAQGKPRPLSRVQGGAFSPAGHLYLSSDSDNCEQNICEHSAIHVFSVLTGKLWDKLIPVDVDSSYLIFKESHELEGITIVNVDGKNLPFGGQIHLLVLDNRCQVEGVCWAWDRIFIKHFGVAPGDKQNL